MIKILNKLGIEGNFLNLIKGIYENSQLTAYLMVKDLDAFSLRSGIRQNAHACHFYSTLY